MQGECPKCGEVSTGFFCAHCGEPLFSGATYGEPGKAVESEAAGLGEAVAVAATPEPSARPVPEPYSTSSSTDYGAYQPSGEPYPNDTGQLPQSHPVAPAAGMPQAPTGSQAMASTPACRTSPPTVSQGGGPPQGYGPPAAYAAAPPRSWSAKKIILFVVIIILLVVGGVPVIMRLIPSPRIAVPVPPGWQEVSGAAKEEISKDMGDMWTIDQIFSHSSYGFMIFIGHGRFKDEPPDTGSVSEMESYKSNNQADFNAMFFVGDKDEAAVEKMDMTVQTMAFGNAALGFSGIATYPGNISLQIDGLLFAKSGTTFAAFVYKPVGADSTSELEFLKQNISFDNK